MKRKTKLTISGVLMIGGFLAVTATGDTIAAQLAAYAFGLLSMWAGAKIAEPYLGEGVTK